MNRAACLFAALLWSLAVCPTALDFARAEPSDSATGQSGLSLIDLDEAESKPDVVTPPAEIADTGSPFGEITNEAKIRAALAQPAMFSLNEKPLSDVVAEIGRTYNISVVLDQRALDAIGIGGDTPVTLHVDGISLKSALRWMLGQLNLTYAIRDELLIITSREEAEAQLTSRVYDVADLVSEEANPFAVSVTPGPPGDCDPLIDVITSTVAPDSWDVVGGRGSISGYSLNSRWALVVRQTDEVHDEIEQLLSSLRKVPRVGETNHKPGDNSVAEQQTRVYIRVYPIADVETVTAGDLAELVRTAIGEEQFAGDNGTFVKAIASTVVVKHNRAIHNRVRELLWDLRVLGRDSYANPSGFGGGFL